MEASQLEDPGRALKLRFLRGGIWAFLGKLITGVGSLIFAALLSRLLIPEELGAYFLALSICSSFGIAACLGQDQLAIKLFAAALSVNSTQNLTGLALRLFAIALTCATLTAAALYWCGSWLFASLFRMPTLLSCIPLLCLWVMAHTLQKMVGEIFRGCHDIKLASWFSGGIIGGNICTVALLASFALIWLTGYAISLIQAIQITVFVTWISVALGMIVLFRRLGGGAASGGVNELLSLLGQGVPLWITSITAMFMGQIDIWIVAAHLSAEKVALYGAVTRLVKFVSTALNVINDVVAPMISELYSQQRLMQLQWLLSMTAGLATISSVPVIMLFIIQGSGTLQFLFGEDYAGGAALLAMLSLAHFLCAATGSTGYTLAMTGYGKQQMLLSVAVIALASLCALVMVNRWGVNGVGAAFTISIVIQQIIMLIMVRRFCGIWTYANFRLSNTVIHELFGFIKSRNQR